MKIEIPFPCSEDIDKMNDEEGGKHCLSCDKIVTDFRNMSLSEIQDYFIKAANKKICGIFESTLISEKKYSIPLEIVRLNYRKRKNVFILSFLVSFGFLEFGCDSATSQQSNLDINPSTLFLDTPSNQIDCIKDSIVIIESFSKTSDGCIYHKDTVSNKISPVKGKLLLGEPLRPKKED